MSPPDSDSRDGADPVLDEEAVYTVQMALRSSMPGTVAGVVTVALYLAAATLELVPSVGEVL